MQLVNNANGSAIALPNELLWDDEFDWSAVTSANSYTLSGSIIVDTATKLAGRPITLIYPDKEMGWITRATLRLLKDWCDVESTTMTLKLEYPNDSRSFNVRFRTNEKAIEAEPVKGFPGHSDTDLFRAKLRLMVV